MRSAEWRRTVTPFRTRLIREGVVGCLVVTGIGFIAHAWLDTSDIYPWKAAAVFAGMSAIALSFVDEHPFPRLGPANRVTIARAMLVALTAGLIGEPDMTRLTWIAVIVGIIVAVLDGVDGWLARRSRLASAFGARIDMETDALLIMVLSLVVWQHGKAGGWILLGGLFRYAFIAAGWMLPWMARPLTPTHRAKTITVIHVVGLIVALAPIVALPLSAIVVSATLMVLAWSFAVDVHRLWRQRPRESAKGG